MAMTIRAPTNSETQQRDQQPGFDVIQLLRNAAEQVIQKPHSQTGSKARDNGPQNPLEIQPNRGRWLCRAVPGSRPSGRA